jgi:glycosyltransferase involved in cell wall biosynthesis
MANKSFNISMIVADGIGDEIKNKISIYDVGINTKGRISRMIKTTAQIFKKENMLKADIYHLHDPELIPIGLKLKRLGKIVIFDAHEDLPKQLLSKSYLPKVLGIILSKIFEYYEQWALPKFNFIITATPFIRNKFLKINPNTIDINNFPIINDRINEHKILKKKEVVYVGGISKIRGIEEIISALSYTKNITLNLVGKICDNINIKQFKTSLILHFYIENLNEIYRSNENIFLIPRIFGSGIPIKFLEAIANNKKCILFGNKKNFGIPFKVYVHIFDTLKQSE